MDTSGEDLRRARKDAHLTQEEVAAALGVTRQTVIAWEHRGPAKPGWAQARANDRAERYLRVVDELARRREDK